MMRLGVERPRDARGLLPLVLGAIALGKGIYGAVNANQVKQRNKGYINDAYRGALQREQVHQQDVVQGTTESLNARGLLQSGAARPMRTGSLTADAIGAAPTTLADRQLADTNRELALEHHDLDAAHSRALNENKAEYTNALIGSATNTAQGIMGAYGAAQTQAATAALGSAGPAGAAAGSASMGNAAPRLIDSVPPGTQMHQDTGEVVGAMGYHPNTALPQTLGAYGQVNADFHVGG